MLFVKCLGIVLHFWLLFYLSEGLIFIPPNNLAFARANAGVGGQATGKKNPSLFVGKFVANPLLSLAGKVGQQERNS